MRLITAIVLCALLALPCSADPPEIAQLRDELAKLQQEIETLRQAVKRMQSAQVEAGQMEWRQVRPPVQLEGGVDDGYELLPKRAAASYSLPGSVKDETAVSRSTANQPNARLRVKSPRHAVPAVPEHRPPVSDGWYYRFR